MKSGANGLRLEHVFRQARVSVPGRSERRVPPHWKPGPIELRRRSLFHARVGITKASTSRRVSPLAPHALRTDSNGDFEPLLHPLRYGGRAAE